MEEASKLAFKYLREALRIFTEIKFKLGKKLCQKYQSLIGA